MYTIKYDSKNQYEVNKSKFITLLYKVNNISEVNNCLNKIKDEYKDATHYCYAYKIGTLQKYNDDGEPGGTAGLPIMEVLNKKDINYILCVVVRYFGGIKLGSGGLVRAYSKATREAITNNNIIELVDGYLIKIEANYNNQKQLDYNLDKYIRYKEFTDKIIYHLEIEKNKINILNNYQYEIIDEIKMKKKFK